VIEFHVTPFIILNIPLNSIECNDIILNERGMKPIAYITEEELLEWLNVKVDKSTLWRWRKQGMPSVKVGKQVRYEKEKVKEWIEKQNK
jgi:excisionase family DNA binding protein